MTIKEAVELYNKKTQEIEDIKNLWKRVTKRDYFTPTHRGEYILRDAELGEIGACLMELVKMKKEILNSEFHIKED